MKNIILIILLSACGRGPMSFKVSDSTLDLDKARLLASVLAINAHLGCNYITLKFNEGVFSPLDTEKGYNFIAFNNQSDMVGMFPGHVLGSTVQSGYPGEADIFLYSFAAFPTPETCDDYATDPKTQHSVCAKYEFSNDDLLSRFVITHEFGHAMGLEHTTDPQDVMFPDINSQWKEGVTDAQWERYIQQWKAAGNKCPSVETHQQTF